MSKVLNVDEENLKKGLLSLVVALVEIIRDALRLQALKRMESGRLDDEEINKLGMTLMDMDQAIEEIKAEQDIVEAVQSTRDGLNDIVEDVIDKIANPERWQEEV